LNCSRLSAVSSTFRSFHWVSVRSAVRNPRGRHCLAQHIFATLLLIFATSASSPVASAQGAVFQTPPVKIPLNVKDQPITIIASATMKVSARDHGTAVLGLELTGDLSDLQRNLTPLLASQLDKDDKCSEVLSIQNATLMPSEPAGLATVRLHYERRACIKAFGKRESKALVGGDARIQIKLTPEIENNSELHLAVDVGEIQADGSLGQLLRSGALGDALREKIRNTILSALQKGTDLSVTLPPSAQGRASIQNAEFKDAGDGRLLVVLRGEVRLTQAELQALASQVKERLARR
jgi:hypothetical protein